ncbi:MAG: patatin-like phospholipase family protein [Flavobacteriaceae bacterium]|jgi:NTE family protein|nr:patatin-like phospholipase family protein [Flavobacteriaceae bacterium]
MNNKRIGLVLSGGGYKGIAHAGVLAFLAEKNIHPTILAGASAGSIVSCLYSNGMEPKEILHFFKSVNLFNWEFLTWSKPGIIDVNGFEKYLKNVFEEKTLGDLPLPIYINATNISTGKIHLFSRQTKVVDAILASSAFPGIFTPYKIEDTIYSDGGILNNFPTDIIKYDCDFLIGCNVCPIQQIDANELKSIKSVAVRAYELMAAMQNRTQGQLCDWLIEPLELTAYSTFERSKRRMDEIYELGYMTAKKSYEQQAHKFA